MTAGGEHPGALWRGRHGDNPEKVLDFVIMEHSSREGRIARFQTGPVLNCPGNRL